MVALTTVSDLTMRVAPLHERKDRDEPASCLYYRPNQVLDGGKKGCLIIL